MIDITGAKNVVLELAADGTVLWVHADPEGRVAASEGDHSLGEGEVTVLRICRIENVHITDNTGRLVLETEPGEVVRRGHLAPVSNEKCLVCGEVAGDYRRGDFRIRAGWLHRKNAQGRACRDEYYGRA